MKVILNLGMGVESSTIAWRWLTEEATRDFDLADLVVVTAMTGSEFPDTKRVVEGHLLPLFRRLGVRYVQLARNGPLLADGITVLSDSRNPDRLHLEGVYSLFEELTTAGTGPQVASRRCSIKAKGVVIDSWLEGETGGTAFRQVMGFNADETKRIDRDQCYGGDGRNAEYPLMQWGWNRTTCSTYLREKTGEDWPKSCCSFCPFARGKEEIVARYRLMPEQAAEALLLERVAMALNHRMTLYADRSLSAVLTADRNVAAFNLLHQKMESMPWAAYQVRRIYAAKGRADRSVTRVAVGTKLDALSALQQAAVHHDAVVEQIGGSPRFWVTEREEGVYPCREEMFVAAPALAKDKEKASFARNWGRVALATV